MAHTGTDLHKLHRPVHTQLLRTKDKDTNRFRLYSMCIESKQWHTPSSNEDRTISVQNNKAKSDLSISTMHMGNSYLGLQQPTASCNAPSIKKLAPSVNAVFPSLGVLPEQRSSVRFKDWRKTEWTHTQTQLITYTWWLLIFIDSDSAITKNGTFLQTEP